MTVLMITNIKGVLFKYNDWIVGKKLLSLYKSLIFIALEISNFNYGLKAVFLGGTVCFGKFGCIFLQNF